MSEGKHILTMLEDLSVEDAAKMQEINARVWFYVGGKYQDGLRDAYNDYHVALQHAIDFGNPPDYLHSRDALKAIRPDGWSIEIAYRYDTHYTCTYGKFGGQRFPTEELAELHAILQTIIYERSGQ